MSAASATYAARRAAARHLFRDAWGIVERPTEGADAPVLNQETGQYEYAGGIPPMTVVYEGPVRVQVRSDINANAVENVTGEREDTYRTATAQFPVKNVRRPGIIGRSSRIRNDDVLTLTRCALDPNQIGRKLNLQADTKGKTHASMRRFRTRELVG